MKKLVYLHLSHNKKLYSLRSLRCAKTRTRFVGAMHMKIKGRYMKYITLFFLLSISYPSFSAEDCSDESIGLNESSHIVENLFYRGTCHYRNEEYDLSAKYWSELSELEGVEDKYQEYQIDSLNNLGYLKFFGYGVTEDKESALKYWKKAILLGHYESEYHLCHAYADKDQPTFNYALGKKHCEKAFLIYNGMEDPDHEIMNQIKNYKSELRNY